MQACINVHDETKIKKNKKKKDKEKNIKNCQYQHNLLRILPKFHMHLVSMKTISRAISSSTIIKLVKKKMPIAACFLCYR